MKKQPVKLLYVLCFLLLFSGLASADSWEKGIIGEGEKWETEVLVYDTQKEGASVLLVGGVHGDEPAGSLAIKRLLDDLAIDKGKLVVIPEANKKALNQNLRYPPGGEDLNRAFTEEWGESWTAQLAKAIYGIIEKHDVNFVFDLHEARDFYRINPNSVGQTIIFNGHDEKILLAWDIAEKINPYLTTLEEFIVLSPTAGNSLTRRAYEDLGLTTFIIETTRKQPMETRITQQKMVVLTALNLLGLKEELELENFAE